MNEQDIIKEFEETGAILKGHFVLSSGLHSDTYLQCAKLLMHPKRAEAICKELAFKIRALLGDVRIDLVLSPALGGIVVGYEVARHLGVPAIFCERVEGIFQLRRGFEIDEGSNVLIVEDVVTTAKSSLEAIRCAESYGGKVIGEGCLVDRNLGNSKLGVPLISLMELSLPLYQPDALPPELSRIPAVKPGSRFLNKAASA